MTNPNQWVSHFHKRLNALHKDYNPDLRLLRRPFKSPGYHTTIREADFVHPTRDALLYAVALLDSGLDTYRERAFHIIERVVSLQDTDRSSHTFGIWSWFYEEPLEVMSPPDWNWADFNGKQLLLAVIRYGALFPAELLERTKLAICNSCDAIIKRNVGPDYTNIAIMGAFVTLIAGERLGEERYLTYGLDRLERFYRYTKDKGTFNEYNSPTYAIIAIEELSSIATETNNAEAGEWVSELLDIAWQMVAYHFHPRLKQWSGPHSRTYETLLPPERLSFLQIACGGQVDFVPDSEFVYGLTWYGNRFACPERYYAYFSGQPDREFVQALSKPNEGAKGRQASTYMDRQLSLGTFSSNIMWNQCRNLLAYLVNGAESTYVHLRVLHDGYDYSSAVYTSVQKRGTVLFGLTFATNGGGTHPNLDRVEGRIVASDLRIRFEIGGSQDAISLEKQENGIVHLRIAGIQLKVKTIYGIFDERNQFDWELSRDENKTYLDMVLHIGLARSFDFHQIGQACCLVAFAVGGDDDPLETELDVQQAWISGQVRAAGGERLFLIVPSKPDTLEALLNFQTADRG